MFIKLLFFFIFIPVAELTLLIQAGSEIGTLPTLALIVLTGVAGAHLARSQGFELLQRLQNEMNQGRLPAEGLMDGLMILAGGLVLLTPGFLTDIFGFICLVPWTRSHLKTWVSRWLEKRIATGQVRIYRY